MEGLGKEQYFRIHNAPCPVLNLDNRLADDLPAQALASGGKLALGQLLFATELPYAVAHNVLPCFHLEFLIVADKPPAKVTLSFLFFLDIKCLYRKLRLRLSTLFYMKTILFVRKPDGTQEGPMDYALVRAAVKAGYFSPQCKVSTDGTNDWQPVSTFFNEDNFNNPFSAIKYAVKHIT